MGVIGNDATLPEPCRERVGVGHRAREAFSLVGVGLWWLAGVYRFPSGASPDGQALRGWGTPHALASLRFGKGRCCLPSHRPASGYRP